MCIRDRGFGCVEINTGRVLGLVDSERNNPRLYDRKTYGRNSRKVPYQQIYSESERETLPYLWINYMLFCRTHLAWRGALRLLGMLILDLPTNFGC